MIEELLANLSERMDKAIENVRHEFSKIRTGKASPALLDSVSVDYYGNPTPLKQIATITTPEPRLIVIQPWEKNLLGGRPR